MDLYLVRHGESAIPVNGVQSAYPLSDLGREQARRLGERFRGLAIDHLVTTPYKRTQETARAIAAVTGVGAIEVPSLGTVDAGGLGIAPFSERRQRWPEYFENPSPLLDYEPFGGEGPKAFNERVTEAFVEQVWDRHSGERVRVFVVCRAETVNALGSEPGRRMLSACLSGISNRRVRLLCVPSWRRPARTFVNGQATRAGSLTVGDTAMPARGRS